MLGYSSLKAGVAFLPFSFGIVIAAAIASNLVTKVDPRWLAGGGTLLAAIGIWGFSRIPYNPAIDNLSVNATYVKDLLPWILIMSFGIGFVFVPITLTAVHGVKASESGIGSGVLNAMQQVGGSLGLAILSTVFVTALRSQTNEIGAAAAGAGQRVSPVQIYNVAFTHGATYAFTVGAIMILAASVITFAFMRVSHEELQTDGATDAITEDTPVPVV